MVQIARLPNRFQEKCAGEVVASYALRPDGRITVTNRCRTTGGETTEATGVARRVDGKPPSVLEVRFAPAFLSFLPAVWGDYQVIALGADYDHAMVGTPDRALSVGALAHAADGSGALPPAARRGQEPGVRHRQGRGDETAARLVARADAHRDLSRPLLRGRRFPHRSVGRRSTRAVITHAHGDHARRGSAAYLCARRRRRRCSRAASAPARRSRRCRTASRSRIGDVRVSFHPAGHVLGSAQVRVEHAGGVWVVSGDYKRAADPTCAPFEPVRCDIFVTESHVRAADLPLGRDRAT